MGDIKFKYDLKKGKGIVQTEFLDEIRENFSEINPNYEIQKKQGKFAPKRYYAITKSGRFNCGIFTLIYKFCKKEYPDYKIKIDNELHNICFPKLNKLNVEETKYPLRDYQKDSLDSALKFGRGIIKVGTGGGKSLIISNLLESFYNYNSEFMAIVFVPNLGLVNQLYSDFKEYEVSFTYTKWTGNHDPKKGCNVTITNVSNFLSKYSPKIDSNEFEIYNSIKDLEKEEIKDLYFNLDVALEEKIKSYFKTSKNKTFIKDENTYKCLNDIKKRLDSIINYTDYVDNLIRFSDCVVIDECHGINNNAKITDAVDSFLTPNRFGFTGTTSKNKMDYWKSVGIIGPVIYTKQSKDLRDTGFLSQAIINIIKIHHLNFPEYVKKGSSTYNYNLELEYCYTSKFRNNIIKSIISKTKNNSLIIVERLEQGEILYNLLKDIKGKRVYYITGQMDVSERDKITQEMEKCNDIICIAISKIFSVGISVNNIHHLFFMSMGKSFIKVIQSIGRGLRKHEDKKKLRIFDICDNLIYSNRHLNDRIDFYDEEHFNYKLKEFYE